MYHVYWVEVWSTDNKSQISSTRHNGSRYIAYTWIHQCVFISIYRTSSYYNRHTYYGFKTEYLRVQVSHSNYFEVSYDVAPKVLMQMARLLAYTEAKVSVYFNSFNLHLVSILRENCYDNEFLKTTRKIVVKCCFYTNCKTYWTVTHQYYFICEVL